MTRLEGQISSRFCWFPREEKPQRKPQDASWKTSDTPPPLTCPQENAGKTPSRRRLDHPGFLAPPPRRSCTSYSAREKNRKWRGFTAYFFPGRISKLNSCSSTTPHDVAVQRARRAAITWFRVRIVTLRSYGVALSFFSALGSYATAPRSYNVALRSH